MTNTFRAYWLVFSILLLGTTFSKIDASNWYSEYWQRFSWKIWEQGPCALKTYVDIKTQNHFKNIRFLQFSEQFLYKATDDITFELHYTYINERSIVAHSPWIWQHRLELELNRKFDLCDGKFIGTRNRLEIRRLKNNSKILYRLRQKTSINFPIENWGCLKSFSLSNELFYNLSTHLFTQNRFSPCTLTFGLNDKVDLEVFFLIRNFLDGSTWHRSAVLGTQLYF